MELGSTGSVWFSGSPETTDFKHLPDGGGESDSGNALVVTIEKNSASDVEVSVVKEAIGQWVFESISMDINSEEDRSEEHTSELQSRGQLVCRLLLEKKTRQL